MADQRRNISSQCRARDSDPVLDAPRLHLHIKTVVRFSKVLVVPKLSQQDMDARRRDILNAAARCFARKGIQATTMREIFAEAGMSAGAVYNYFKTKDELIAAGLVASTAESADAILAGADLPESGRDFRATMSDFLSDLEQARVDGRAKATPMIHAEVAVRPEMLEIFRQGRTRIRDAARQQIARLRPELTEAQCAVLAGFVFALYQGLVTEAALEETSDLPAMGSLIDHVLTSYVPSA